MLVKGASHGQEEDRIQEAARKESRNQESGKENRHEKGGKKRKEEEHPEGSKKVREEESQQASREKTSGADAGAIHAAAPDGKRACR
ncbi:MAG TPA: hypothetical protein VKH44_09830 [Pirellulaceae bacterium]|nr:hypothetical protein [Pirellulaceae bacterium]